MSHPRLVVLAFQKIAWTAIVKESCDFGCQVILSDCANPKLGAIPSEISESRLAFVVRRFGALTDSFIASTTWPERCSVAISVALSLINLDLLHYFTLLPIFLTLI